MLFDYQYTIEVSAAVRPRIYKARDGSWVGRWGSRIAKGSEEFVQEWAWNLIENGCDRIQTV